MKEKGFSKDFIMVVIGQIISLFGNAALRFALPLYLLNQTGSSALYGTVTACAFLPSIAMSPIGGIVADRVNKRNIMVALDFLTAAVVGGLAVCLRFGNEVLLIALTLMLLYGIAGAYQPSVQAAIPVLVRQEKVMSATSIINTVSSLSSLTGPVLGGILYSMYGLVPVLILCTTCFFASAVMEIFIHIPYQKPEKHDHIVRILKTDFAQGIHFAWKENRKIGEVVLIICGINLFLSAMMIVGIPYLVTEVLELANQLCGRRPCGRWTCRRNLCGYFCKETEIQSGWKSDYGCGSECLPDGNHSFFTGFGNSSLWSNDGMLFWDYDVCYYFHCTDDVLCTDRNAPQSDGEGHCPCSDGIHLFSASWKCDVWDSI